MNWEQRIKWLEDVTRKGACPAIVNDDNGHWAVSFEGMQSVPQNIHEGDDPKDVNTMFFIRKHQWKSTIASAIDYAKDNYDQNWGN